MSRQSRNAKRSARAARKRQHQTAPTVHDQLPGISPDAPCIRRGKSVPSLVFDRRPRWLLAAAVAVVGSTWCVETARASWTREAVVSALPEGLRAERTAPLLAAAPTIVKKSSAPAGNLPGHTYRFSVGFAERRNIDTTTFQWNASGSGTDEVFLTLNGGGDPTATLTSGTISNPRCYFELSGSTGGSNMVFMPEGAAGSLAAYEFDYADNDSLGFSTWYVRLPSGAAPPALTCTVVWDESDVGDGSDLQDCTSEWRVASCPESGWRDQYRVYHDWKWGEDVDLATETWTDERTSRIQGFAFGFVAEAAGDYVVENRFTNTSGEQTVSQWTFTVAAEARTKYTVNSAGGADYTSIDAACTAGRQWIEVAGGHTESKAGAITSIPSECRIEWDGTGAKPLIYRTTTLGEFITITNRTDVTLYGIVCAATGTTNVSATGILQRGLIRGAFVACGTAPGASPETDLVGIAYKSEHGTSGSGFRGSDSILHWNRGSASDAYEDYFFAATSGSHPQACEMSFGCYCPASPTEPSWRHQRNFFLTTICGCYIKADSNDGLRINSCSNYIYGNRIDGNVSTGVYAPGSLRSYRNRIASNIITRSSASTSVGTGVSCAAGTCDTTIVNNVVICDRNLPGLGGNPTAPGETVNSPDNPFLGYSACVGVKILCNTISMLSGDKPHLIGPTGDYVSGQVAGNLCNVPASSTWTGTAVSVGDWTASGNSEAADYELDEDYVAAAPGTTAKIGAAYDDVWGNVRSAMTSLGGAQYAKAGTDPGPDPDPDPDPVDPTGSRSSVLSRPFPKETLI